MAIAEGKRRQLRGLMGSLAWPSRRAAPRLQRSVSLGQGAISNDATAREFLEANETLGLAKADSDVSQAFPKICEDTDDVASICMTDAAWAVRRDGSSQWGLLDHGGPQ